MDKHNNTDFSMVFWLSFKADIQKIIYNNIQYVFVLLRKEKDPNARWRDGWMKKHNSELHIVFSNVTFEEEMYSQNFNIYTNIEISEIFIFFHNWINKLS